MKRQPATGKGRLHFIDQFRVLRRLVCRLLTYWRFGSSPRRKPQRIFMQRMLNFCGSPILYNLHVPVRTWILHVSITKRRNGWKAKTSAVYSPVSDTGADRLHPSAVSIGEALFHYAIVGLLALPSIGRQGELI